MLKNFLILCLAVPTLTFASPNRSHTLSCTDESLSLRPKFGLAADFVGTSILGRMVVANSYTSRDRMFKIPLAPSRANDMVKSKKFDESPYLSYSLGREPNGCSYTFNTPLDLVDYVKRHEAGLPDSFSALWVIHGPECNVPYSEIDLRCNFVN